MKVIEKLPLERRPMSMKSVVEAIGSPDITYAKIQRAVKAGKIKSGPLDNGKRMIRICDVLEAMGFWEDHYEF